MPIRWFLSSYQLVFQGFPTVSNVHSLATSQAWIKRARTLMISLWISTHFKLSGRQSGSQIFGGLGLCWVVMGLWWCWVSGGWCLLSGD